MHCRDRSQIGRAVSSVAYSRAIATMHQVGLAMAKFQQTYDVILSPTLAKPPVPLGVLSLSPESMAAYGKDVTEFGPRSEEHTSELQSQSNLVCRLLLEKKKKEHLTS